MSNSVLAIVIVSVVFSVLYKMYNRYLEYKAETIAHTASANSRADELNAAHKQQINSLIDRIEILEKIVTDEGYQVQKDIKNL
jgi:hypothetical protein